MTELVLALIIALILAITYLLIFRRNRDTPPYHDPYRQRGDEIFRYVDVRRVDPANEEAVLALHQRSLTLDPAGEQAVLSLLNSDTETENGKSAPAAARDTETENSKSVPAAAAKEASRRQALLREAEKIGALLHESRRSGSYRPEELTSHYGKYSESRKVFETLERETWVKLLKAIEKSEPSAQLHRQLSGLRALTYAKDTSTITDEQLAALRGPILLPAALAQKAGVSRRTILSAARSNQLDFEGLVGGVNVLGIGDLRLLRQEIIGYEPREIAYIQNVMASERRTRDHRETDRVEETSISESEETTTEETELSETTRFEVQRELERQTQEDIGLEAEAQLTASYGFVTVNANTRGSYAQTSSEARSESSTFAKDIVERSVNKVQKRILKRRERRQFREVVETNQHAFINKSTVNHIIGIYRWLSSTYRVELWNYGRRLMLEVLIPEPGRHYWANNYSATEKELRGLRVPAPPNAPRDRILENGTVVSESLASADDVTEENYLFWAAQYQVESVTPPPSLATVTAALNGQDNAIVELTDPGGDSSVRIPEGYRAVRWRHRHWIQYHQDDQDNYRLILFINGVAHAFRQRPHHVQQVGGDQSLSSASYADTLLDNSGPSAIDSNYIGVNEIGQWKSLDGGGINDLKITAYGDKVERFIVHVELELEPLDDTVSQWRIDVFQEIQSAYRAAVEEHEAAVARLRSEIESAQKARNLRTLDLEHTELKRAAVAILRGKVMGARADPLDKEGRIASFTTAFENGLESQFFEQSIEWKNISYTLYPFFWAARDEKSGWYALLNRLDQDAQFERFLRSGYARAVLPVRPGYEIAVLNYLHASPRPDDPWEAGPPTLNSGDPAEIDMYVGIVDEFSAPFGDEVLEDSWSVSLPTSLVYLQKGRDLAGTVHPTDL